MIDSKISPTKIAIVSHPQASQAADEALKIETYLNNQGIITKRSILYEEGLSNQIEAGEFDMLIALGGDGTMLRAGHLCAPCGIPILGINLGHFGFLMEVRQNQWKDVFPRLFQGDYWLEQRMMLCAEHFHEGNSLGKWEVLNEVVVGRGQAVRPVHLIAHVDERYLTTYVADALIASTATGSTAYAMAAGGPILPPELRNILLVPVAPHLSIDRAIMLSEGSTVTITVETSHEAVVCIDGQTPEFMESGDLVNVRASGHSAQFVRFQDPGYFYRNLTPHMNQNPSTGANR
ncbi:MAG: NAD(+)/NADH kinase [Anaerolineales bacterium]|nr:NAD(+)/NADH kinase [Anaerolineales bacterium]